LLRKYSKMGKILWLISKDQVLTYAMTHKTNLRFKMLRCLNNKNLKFMDKNNCIQFKKKPLNTKWNVLWFRILRKILRNMKSSNLSSRKMNRWLKMSYLTWNKRIQIGNKILVWLIYNLTKRTMNRTIIARNIIISHLITPK